MRGKVVHVGSHVPAPIPRTLESLAQILMSSRTFHAAIIGGRRFEAVLSADGPYICCGLDGVALGSCTSIEQLSPGLDAGIGQREVTPHSWWIAKYRTQPRISLNALRQEERQQLAEEFGIRVGYEDGFGEPFWDCPAFPSLASWVKKHPRAAARFADYNAYLPGWHDAALAFGAVSA
jgi:hypothetical protein